MTHPTHPLIRATALLGALFAAGAVHAQATWTSVGSAGVVDELDTGIVEFVQNEARTRASAAAGSELNLRYNITMLEGFAGPGQYLMRVRFRDSGADAQVRLDLRRVETTGTSSTLHSFSSDAYAASAGYQTQQICAPVSWDFTTAGYWIEATLRKTGASGTPGLALIQLVPVASCIL